MLKSIDWLMGKSEPETIDFPMISMGFSCKFSRKNQSIVKRTNALSFTLDPCEYSLHFFTLHVLGSQKFPHLSTSHG